MLAVSVATPAQRLRKHLTMSQQQALRALLGAMEADEDTVIVSAIADGEGLQRSTAVSAITLAEAAGLVAARSLGMRGTRIRILDRAALEEAVGS